MNCSLYRCAYDVQNDNAQQHRAGQIISPLTLQTITITTACMCLHITAHNLWHARQHRTVVTIFHLIFQTAITNPVLSLFTISWGLTLHSDKSSSASHISQKSYLLHITIRSWNRIIILKKLSSFKDWSRVQGDKVWESIRISAGGRLYQTLVDRQKMHLHKMTRLNASYQNTI